MRLTVDDIEFEDDEPVEFGSDTDYALDFDSGNDRAQLADVANGTFVHFPRNLGTDLTRGHFAETVDEGKALADDGETYDSIQDAVDAASSWVKVGPGTFNESLYLTTANLSVFGSGDKTIVHSTSSPCFDIVSDNIRVNNLKVTGDSSVNLISINSTNATIDNCTGDGGNRFISNSDFGGAKIVNNNCANTNDQGIGGFQEGAIVAHNIVKNTGEQGITSGNPANVVIANNTVIDAGTDGIILPPNSHDSIIIGNTVDGYGSTGITVTATDCIIANNRIIGSGTDIDDSGTNTVLDANNTN